MKKFLHIGHDHFNPELFNPIKNDPEFDKPCGGFWVTSCESEERMNGWLNFVTDKFSGDLNINKRFYVFTKDDVNIARIASVKDIKSLEKYILNTDVIEKVDQCINERVMIGCKICFDFERMLNDGIDAVELILDNEEYEYLHWMFYSWDVSSVLILNKDIIIGEMDSTGTTTFSKKYLSEFNSDQIREILTGSLLKVDCSIYTDPKFNPLQMREIREGLENKLDVSIYANPRYNFLQMGAIRQGLTVGIDVSQYANPDLSRLEMDKIKDLLMSQIDEH